MYAENDRPLKGADDMVSFCCLDMLELLLQMMYQLHSPDQVTYFHHPVFFTE